MKRLRILLLCDDRPGNANTILEHIEAFRRFSRHDVRTFNPRGMTRSYSLDLDEFDVVAVHYSLILSNDRYISPAIREKLRRYRGLKVQFVQDEYRWVDRMTTTMREVGINLLFTVAPEPAASQLYDERLPGVRRVLTLTGYVPTGLEDVERPSLGGRRLDVAYRGRDIAFWLGNLSQEKFWIGQRFLELAPKFDLRCDIAWREGDRIYGQAWFDFLASARATLGTESGASIADFDGGVESATRAYMREHKSATFSEVHRAVLEPFEGNVVVNVISPRVFEAVAVGTALVMFPGEYSGIPVPGEHYIVLEKDFSNIDEVAQKLKDDGFLSALTQRAHADLVQSGRWSYRTFIEEFDAVVESEAGAAPARPGVTRYHVARVERWLRVPPPHARLATASLNAASAVRGREFARRSEIESGTWLAKGAMATRAAMFDGDLRPLFVEGRRAGHSFDGLLEEILELSLLRRAAAGSLPSVDRFIVDSEYEPATRTLRFVSRPVEGAENANGRVQAAAALRTGSIDAIEWDHTAVGDAIRFESSSVEIGIGSAGVKTYSLLLEIGRRKPELLRQALLPVIEDGPQDRRG